MITFHPDIFPFNIAVVRANELDNLSEFVDAEGNKISYREGALGMVVKALRIDKEYNTRAAYSMIVFKDTPCISTIAHEATHSAFDLLENIGIERDSSDEVFAYTIGYIVGCINEAINKDKIWE